MEFVRFDCQQDIGAVDWATWLPALRRIKFQASRHCSGLPDDIWHWCLPVGVRCWSSVLLIVCSLVRHATSDIL